MTLWIDAARETRSALLILLFAAMCAGLFCLLKLWEKRAKRFAVEGAVCFAALLLFLYELCEGKAFDRLPVAVVAAVCAVSVGAVLCQIAFLSADRRGKISDSSIKEAMDDLPVGGCYFAKRGRIKLCNRQMYRLVREMTGRDLQSLSELHTALSECQKNGIGRTHDGGYRFPDGSVWFYSERVVEAGDREVYTEAVFTNATELSAANEELYNDNRELSRINKKLRKMYARAEDRVREREYLTFKMKVHDDIGRSLAVIRRAIAGEIPEDDIAGQIKTLSVAAGTLVYSAKAGSDDPYDILLSEAAELGVEIRLDGMLPIEPLIYELTVSAVKECVTNCVRHAHGSLVRVRIEGIRGGYTVTLTNNGERPKGKITPGGGLSNLRRRVENAGGEMLISHYPEFMLRLTFMREEMEL